MLLLELKKQINTFYTSDQIRLINCVYIKVYTNLDQVKLNLKLLQYVGYEKLLTLVRNYRCEVNLQTDFVHYKSKKKSQMCKI